jgi:tetratricopeptide (TPR) repeat protein
VNTTAPSPAQRRYLLIALLAVAAIIVWQAGEIWMADYQMRTGQPDEMRKGAALVPGNAEAWDRLGRYYLLSFSDPSIPLALSNFQRAVKVDPLSENYWLDLAAAYDAEGNSAEAESAYEQAHTVYPTSAIVDWAYGNFLLREGKQTQAFDEIELAVRGDPNLLRLAISRAWHSTNDIEQVLDHVIPPNVNSYYEALDFFASTREVQPGLAVWQRLVALKQPIVLRRTYNFLFEVIHENDGDDALRVWNEAVAAAGEPDLAVHGDSLVSDGTFQDGFPNGGLGWQWQSQDGTVIDFDSSTPDGKGRSVRLDFSGSVNTNLSEPVEDVAVEPGQTYHFHAAIRTDQISTDSGMRFMITDPIAGGVNVQSENLTGTHPWTNVDLDVTTTPRTHFLAIELFRDPSQRFDNKLSGSAWIADVSLVPAEASTAQAHQ